MSDKEFLREIREEIKCSTSKMLQQSESLPKPLKDDQWLDADSPNANDPTEVDPGFEFVDLVPSDEKVPVAKGKDGKKNNKKQQKAEAAGAKPSEKSINHSGQSTPLSSEVLKKRNFKSN